MSEELKPCPFCGGEAELDTRQAYRALSGGTLGSRAAVYCARCDADMGFCYEDAPGIPREDIVNQVVDDWNRRAPSPDMREAVEALTTLIYEITHLSAEDDKGRHHCYISKDALESARTALRSLTGAKP